MPENKYTLIRDIPYTASRDHRNSYDLYLPEGDAPCPLLIYFYGGMLKKGKKDNNIFAPFAASAGIATAVADYRIYPEAAYPDFINDAADAVCAAMRDIGKYTSRINKIYIGGHSAGAYLSMMLCFDGQYLAARNIAREQISGYLFISGEPTKHMSVLEAAGEDPRAVVIDETSAIWHIRSSAGRPVLIATSDCDMPNRREQNYLLYGTLRHFEYSSQVYFVDIPGCKHGDFTKPDANGNVPILPHILKFISTT